MKYEKIPINDIVVSIRIRRNLGDIKSLAGSIKKLGLLSPLIINEENKLLAGERRLEACKLLGWDEVDVSIIPTADAENALDVEVAENRFRKDFTREELVNAGIEMERIESIKSQERRMSTLKQNSTEVQNMAPRRESGKTRDIVAKKLGLSHTQYEREKFIVENKDLISPGEYDDWNNRIISTNKIFNAIKRIQEGPVEKIESIKESPAEKAPSYPPDYEQLKKKLGELENALSLANKEIETKDKEIDSLLAEDPHDDEEINKLRQKCDEADKKIFSYEEEITRLRSRNSPLSREADTAYDFWVKANTFAKTTLAPFCYDEIVANNQNNSSGEYILNGCNLLIEAATDIIRRFKSEIVDVI